MRFGSAAGLGSGLGAVFVGHVVDAGVPVEVVDPSVEVEADWWLCGASGAVFNELFVDLFWRCCWAGPLGAEVEVGGGVGAGAVGGGPGGCAGDGVVVPEGGGFALGLELGAEQRRLERGPAGTVHCAVEGMVFRRFGSANTLPGLCSSGDGLKTEDVVCLQQQLGCSGSTKLPCETSA